MTFSVCGIGAAETVVAFRTDEEIGVDPVDDEASLTLTHPGNCQHVVLGGTDTELLMLLDRARAVVLDHVLAAHPIDGDEIPRGHPAVAHAYTAGTAAAIAEEASRRDALADPTNATAAEADRRDSHLNAAAWAEIRAADAHARAAVNRARAAAPPPQEVVTRTYEITVNTDNPDFLTRLIHAAETLGLHQSMPDDGSLVSHHLVLDVNEWDPQRDRSDHLWGTVYEPTQGGES